VLQSEYNFCLSLSKPCCPNLSTLSAWIWVDHTFRGGERESVCVVSCSLEAFCLILLFNFEVALKNIKKSCSKKIEKEKNKQQQKRGFVCVFLLFLRWCFVITFVSRLISLAQSSLGSTYYHRWTISQLSFFANVVLVLPCLLLSATYSSTYLPTAASQGFLCQHRYIVFQVADLLVAFPILWSKVRIGELMWASWAWVPCNSYTLIVLGLFFVLLYLFSSLFCAPHHGRSIGR
jgi:hypothetical protein